MESTKGLMDNILPPRLEDAGLEDCALPPDAIKEAFFKAATAVRSIISTSDDEDDGHCIDDPWPGVSSDVLVGINEGANSPPGGCTEVKGEVIPDSPVDDVEVIGEIHDEKKVDKVVGPPLPEIEGACVDGLQGLKIGEQGKEVNNGDDKDEKKGKEKGKKKEKPILVEGYF